MQHSGLGLWARDNHCVGWGRGDNPLPLVLADDVADALVRLAAHEGNELDGKALNLAADPAMAEVKKLMRARLEERLRATGDPRMTESGFAHDQATYTGGGPKHPDWRKQRRKRAPRKKKSPR